MADLGRIYRMENNPKALLAHLRWNWPGNLSRWWGQLRLPAGGRDPSCHASSASKGANMPDNDGDDGDIKDLPRYIVPESGPRVEIARSPRLPPPGYVSETKPDTCAEPLPIDVPTPGKIMEDEIPFPAADSLWRHVGTGGIYRVVAKGAGRLPGGPWRHGGVIYRAVSDGQWYWRCFASWRQSFVPHTPENNFQDSG